MPAAAWIALGGLAFGLIVQLVLFVRHYTKLEASINSLTEANDEAKKQRDKFENVVNTNTGKLDALQHSVGDITKDVLKIDKRVESVERKLDESKVVMLRPHHRGPV